MVDGPEGYSRMFIAKNQANNKNNRKKAGKQTVVKSRKPKKAVVMKALNSVGPVALSHCAAKYATAIADPWNPMAQGACIPTFPSRASQKSTTFVRATVTIGVNGIGFVVVAPCLANNAPCMYTSNALYVPNDAIIINTTTTSNGEVTASYNNNAPWAFASLLGTSTAGAPVSGRIVSAGLSTQYTGTTFNQGGLSYALTSPVHSNLNNYTLTNFGAFAETSIKRIDASKNWLVAAGISAEEVQYPPRDADTDVNFLEAIYPYSSTTAIGGGLPGNNGAAIMGFLFKGLPGNTFQVEYVQHAEYIGAATSPMATPTHSDARGFEMVNTASNRIPALKATHPNASTPSLMTMALREVSNELAPYARGAVKMVGATALNAVGSYLTGGMAGNLGGSAMRMIGA